MSFASNVYSPLNRYTYENKNTSISVLDTLSTPWRRVSGGRDVCMLSQTNENEMSTLNKVVTAFFLIIIFPVGVVSFVALVGKLATSPRKWEAKKVSEQSEQTWRCYRLFNAAFARNDYEGAISSFNQRPELAKRSDVHQTLFQIVNRKINAGSAWSEIEVLLPHLKTNHAISLINHAVKTRLELETRNTCYLLTAHDLMSFIDNSLKYSNLQNIESCYDTLFAGALQINTSENPIKNCVKLGLADEMMKSLIQRQLLAAPEGIQRISVQTGSMTIRSKIFSSNNDYLFSAYGTMFRSPQEMLQNDRLLQQICSINRKGSARLDILRTFLNDSSGDPLERVASGFRKLALNVMALQQYANEEELTYMQATRTFAGDMERLLRSTTLSSDVEQLNANLGTLMRQQMDALPVFNEQPRTILAGVELMKRQRLFHYTEEMKRALLVQLMQVLSDMFPQMAANQ